MIKIRMNITEEILKNGKYKKIVNKLSNQTLKLLAEDHISTLKAAHKGVSEVEPEKANDMEYLEAQADAIQSFAKMILKKRKKNS